MPSRRAFRRCWSAAMRSKRACGGCTSPTAPASPGCWTAANCCCPPDRRGRRSRPTCGASSASSPTPGSSGLVLELGTHYRYVPAVVAEAAAERGLALIVLHREVKFVALTEAVHSRIIAGQTDALRARDEVRERFTALVLRGSPADFIVHQLAQTLGRPGDPREPRPRGGRGRGAAGARRGAVHRLGAALPLRASPRRAAARAGGGAGRRGVARRAGRGARHPLGESHRAARAGSSGGTHGRAGAGRDRTRGRAPRRRRRRRVGPHRSAAGCSMGCSRAVSPASGAPPLVSRRPGCRCTGARLFGIVVSGARVSADAAMPRRHRRSADARSPARRPTGSPAPASATLLSVPADVTFDDAAALAFAGALVDPGADRRPGRRVGRPRG